MKDDKLSLRGSDDTTVSSAENLQSEHVSAVPTFNPTAQMKDEPHQMQIEEEDEVQMKKGPFQMQIEEDEEDEMQLKKGPFQMQIEEEEEDDKMQLKKGAESAKNNSETATKTSLPPMVQAKMESSLGADFSNVDIHANSGKASNKGDQAYAQGNEVHFAPGKFNPECQSGQELIGHELTHVVQQRQGRVQPTKQLKSGFSVNDDPGLEKEADVMGAKTTSQSSQQLGHEGSNLVSKNLPLQLKPAAQHTNSPIMRKPSRQRPTLLPLKPVGPDTYDHLADSSQAQQEQWEQLGIDILDLRLKLKEAQNVSWHPTRDDWYRRADSMNKQLNTTNTTEKMDSIRGDFDDLVADMWDAVGAPADEWSTLKDEAALAAAEMLSLADVEGIYAYDFLMKKFKQTSAQMQRINEHMRLREDFVDFAEVIGTREYESHGKLRAARERFRELMQMLDTVGDLRGSGEDANEIIPGWEKLVDQEIDILIDLAGEATAITHTQRFSILQGRLQNAKQNALSRKPKKMGFLEKGDAFSRGVIGAVVNPFVEAAKQGVDLVKITAFTGYKLAGGDGWVPELYSDMAEHVDKTGAGTLDLLKGIPDGLIETPKRCFDAIKNGDWKAIGEMSANLFMLVHAARKGPSRVKKLPGDVKRAAVQAIKVYRILKFRALSLRKGPGMSQAALKAVQKIAVEHGLEISFRPVSRTVTKLRRKGHPGKPEHLKMKTIDELDVRLGANKADIGKVGYFKPLDQPNIKGLSSAKIADVYVQKGKRRREYWRLQDDVNKMVADGKIELRNGVVFEKGGKAYTGDHDAFSFTHDGKDISFEKLRAEVRNKLKADPIHTEHGAALSWDDIKVGQAEYYAGNILKHRPGGERLVVFKPDGTIAREFFDD